MMKVNYQKQLMLLTKTGQHMKNSWLIFITQGIQIYDKSANYDSVQINNKTNNYFVKN